MPADDVVIEIDVASFTDRVWRTCYTTNCIKLMCDAGHFAGLCSGRQMCRHVHMVEQALDLPQGHGERRGKMLGVLDRLRHIQSCGATTVMLRPLTASGPGALLVMLQRM